MNIISELISVLLPWLVLAVIVPLMLLAVRPAVRLYCRIRAAIEAARTRRLFSSYTQRGFY